MKRRNILKGIAGVTASAVFGSISRSANAQIGFMNVNPMPAIYVAHGSPLLLTDKVRGAELAAWGAALPKPKGIVVMTPHFRGHDIQLGHVGSGQAMYNLPDWILEKMPRVSYATPSNEALVGRVRELLTPAGTVKVAQDRPGFDHTTWIPLFHMFPKADIPVVEIALPFEGHDMPYLLGNFLAPLRDEGVLLMASGTITHNLVAADLEGKSAVPAWSRDFDAWVKTTLESKNSGRLLDWRREAPNPDIAHPDDGGHFRALFFAMGAAQKKAVLGAVKFPVEGFELGNLSKRCVEIA